MSDGVSSTAIMPMVESVELTAPPLLLHRKLAQIMYEAERIPKRGRAPTAMGGYPFVQVGDAADYIRKALGEHLVTMLPTHIQIVGQREAQTKAGGSMTVVDLIVDWTFTDGESGEAMTIQSFGAGADAGDKYSGKVSTSAMKYAMMTAFLLSTGEDSELGSHSDAKQDGGSLGVLPPNRPPLERTTHDDGLFGIAERGKAKGKDRDGNPKGPPADTQYELRQEATRGHIIGFRLTQGRKGFKVLAFGPLAEALAERDIIGQHVTCWGTMHDESFTNDDGREIAYQVVHLSRIKWADGELPGAVDPTLPETTTSGSPNTAMTPPATNIGDEAESAPLFDDDLSDLPADWGPAR